jgi:hypothetical protein
MAQPCCDAERFHFSNAVPLSRCKHTRGAVEPTTCNPVFRAAAGCRELRSHAGLLSRTSRRATVPCLRESGRAPLSKGVIVRGGYGEFRIRMNLNGIRLLGAGDAATGTQRFIILSIFTPPVLRNRMSRRAVSTPKMAFKIVV